MIVMRPYYNLDLRVFGQDSIYTLWSGNHRGNDNVLLRHTMRKYQFH